MTPAEFVPEFDDSVREHWGNSSFSVAINPRYCLTETSAKILAKLFPTPPVIFMAPPIQQAFGSPFAFNHAVPFFRFADGTERNAAILAQYWGMPGVPLSKVMDYVNWDIGTAVEPQ